MTLKNDGQIVGSRVARWKEWKPGSVGIFHHIIPDNQLRSSWNEMVRIGMSEHKKLFLQQAAAGAPSGSELPIDEFLRTTAQGKPVDPRFDYIETALTWQAYNIAFGPQHRPSLHRHSDGFDDLGIPAQHASRIFLLRDVYETMSLFTHEAKSGSISRLMDQKLGDAIETLSSVTHKNIIPSHEVNWYGLHKSAWAKLSPHDRKVYNQYIIDSKLVAEGHAFNSKQSSEYASETVEYLKETGKIHRADAQACSLFDVCFWSCDESERV